MRPSCLPERAEEWMRWFRDQGGVNVWNVPKIGATPEHLVYSPVRLPNGNEAPIPYFGQAALISHLDSPVQVDVRVFKEKYRTRVRWTFGRKFSQKYTPKVARRIKQLNNEFSTLYGDRFWMELVKDEDDNDWASFRVEVERVPLSVFVL